MAEEEFAESGGPAGENTIDGEDRFASLAALRLAHLAFMQAQSGEGESAPSRHSAEEIHAFLAKARATGAVIDDDDDRRAAQRILDYWSADLLASPDVSREDFSPASLAPYVFLSPESSRLDDADPAAGPEKGLLVRREQSRQQIRLSALARQWRDGGKAPGYLLKGRALDDAKQYRDVDADIRALVEASERGERHAKNSLLVTLAVVCTVLAALSGLALYQRSIAMEERRLAVVAAEDATKQRKIAEEKAGESEAQTKLAQEAAETSRQLQLEAERLYAQAQADAKVMSDRLVELENKQKSLDAAIAFIKDQLRKGNIASVDVPPDIAAAIRPAGQQDVFSDQSGVVLSGYDSMFMGVNVPLPALSDANRGAAFEQGKPVDYINYSLVLNRERRMAFYTAENMDRDQRLVLPRARALFYPDPRLEKDVQPDAAWFSGNDIDRGHLANRLNIAWGPQFQGDEAAAALRLAEVINVNTNLTPQFDTFNQGVWFELERWVLNEHNPFARQVTIFTGPVLSDDDPVVGNVRMPRRFWKIAVSAKPTPFQGKPAGELVVDAFLVSQFRDGTDEKVERLRDLDVDLYRVPVTEIERVTGLQFDALIHAADQANIPIVEDAPGDVLARKVPLLDGATADERKAVAQEIVNAIRDSQLAEPEQKKVVAALLDMARDQAMQQLTATGRLNLLYVLSQIPVESWQRPGWIDLLAGTRRAAADLENRAASGQTQIGPQTRGHLDLLKQHLGLTEKPAQTVNFQFAGMTREAAVAISDKLKELGWQVPGEERTGDAAYLNEVRYNPDLESDSSAAELLAADLRAAGQTQVCCAKPNPSVKSGTIEIWVSR